jgi:hypothetical protein
VETDELNREENVSTPSASDARFGAVPALHAPRWVTSTVVGGLLLLGVVAFFTVWGLETAVVEESVNAEWRTLEGHLRMLVDRSAREEIAVGEGGMEAFTKRLLAIAEGNPAILGLVVLTPTRQVLGRFSRHDDEIPCASMVPLEEPMESEHPAGEFGHGRVGCLAVPIVVNGAHHGSVVMHTVRDPLAEGPRAGELVRRTALRLAPVFIGFYALLAILLLIASRAARRWRLRAASAERVEALGVIADGINHEIRNPLNAVSLSLQFLSRRHDDGETREVVESARENASRIGRTLDEFARFTRLSRIETEAVSIGERLRAATDGLGGKVVVKGDARGRADPEKLDQALQAIAGFLGQHACSEGVTQLSLSQGGGEWRLFAECEAPELDQATVDRLFDPYVRPRPRDVGRGLAFARAVFQAHGGDLVAGLKGSSLTVRGRAPRVPPGESK